jgi:hypothetical protein
MALPPGASMAATGEQANTPGHPCKAAFCFSGLILHALGRVDPAGVATKPGPSLYLTCPGAQPSMAPTEGTWPAKETWASEELRWP